MIRVVIISEFRFCGEGLARYIASLPNLAVAGIFCRTSAALADTSAIRPDAVLLDSRFEDAEWLVSRFRSSNPDLEVIALGIEDSAEQVIACGIAGFSGFLPASAPLSELGPLIHSVVDGQLQCSPRLSKHLFLALSRWRSGSEVDRLVPSSRLTDREQQILTLIGRGCSNKNIAQELSISHSTVKNHVHSILTKLNVGCRSDAASLRQRNGLLAPAGANGRYRAIPAEDAVS